MDINDLKNKTVLVIGAGKTGIASTEFLIGKTKEVLLSEINDEPEQFKDKIKELNKAGVKAEFNNNSEEFIKEADLVIVSPGIKPGSQIINKIKNLNIPIISDIELAGFFIKKPIIAVTGTNGKTTTTTLITHILNSSGKKAIACGNIGSPITEVIRKKINNEVDYYVIEISSFQIFYSPTLSCDIAICLNITPDHLDWHGDYNHYIETKKKLFLQQKHNSWAILNYSDNIAKKFTTKSNVFYFSTNPDILNNHSLANIAYYENDILKIKEKDLIQEIIKKDELKIIGLHNIENSLASIAACKILNIDTDNLRNGLRSFQGVEHRIEFVKTVNGKEFYNDSKATNPEATIKAIQALSGEKARNGKKISLILGGRDKKTSLNEMINLIKRNICEVILYGEARDRFEKELNNNNYKEIKIVKDLNEAVITSLKSKTDVVLFSPACSSFDMFKNYEERGKSFKDLVRSL